MDMRNYIHQLESIYRERVFLLLMVRLAWFLIATALLYILLDVVFAFAGGVRLGLDGLAVLALVLCVAWSARLAYRSRAIGRMLLRMVEEGNPDLENTLTNALDFEGRMDGPGAANFSRALMAREIANATAHTAEMGEYKALTPPTLKKEGGALLGLATLLALGAVVFPAVFLTVVPRYLLPFGDFPPYSSIRFAVAPGNTTVDYGESLKIEVTTSNRIPPALTLALMDEDGHEVSTIAMHDAGDGVFFQTLENVQTPVYYLARARRGRTKMYQVSLNTVPRIEDVVVAYEYPSYTFRDPETTVLSDDVLRGYKDTQVTISIRSNRPLRGGRLEANGQHYELGPGPEANVVETRFPLLAGGSFLATIEDVDGNRAEQGLRGTIELIPDQKPEIVIANPGMDSFAVPDSKIPILVDASDDLGITRIAFFRRHNESSDARKFLYEDSGRASFVTADDTLDLKDLGVKPGDTIDYYATATDSNPDSPQTATSQSFRLQIISYDEYREYAQSQMTAQDLREKYEAIQDEMEALAEEQRKIGEAIDALEEKLAAEGALSEEEQEQLAALEQAQAALAEDAADFAERLTDMAERPVVFDIENEYKDALRDFAERLAEANEHMEQAARQMAEAGEPQGENQPDPAGNPSSPSEESESPDGDETARREGQSSSAQQSLQRASAEQQKALEQLAQNMEQFQEGIQQANENLEHVANVMADVEQFKYLYELQKSLERSIGYYKDIKEISPEDEARLEELASQQAEVKQLLAELKDTLRVHADELDALAQEEEGIDDGLPQE